MAKPEGQEPSFWEMRNQIWGSGTPFPGLPGVGGVISAPSQGMLSVDLPEGTGPATCAQKRLERVHTSSPGSYEVFRFVPVPELEFVDSSCGTFYQRSFPGEEDFPFDPVLDLPTAFPQFPPLKPCPETPVLVFRPPCVPFLWRGLARGTVAVFMPVLITIPEEEKKNVTQIRT